jgi:hypothetical protein
MKKMLVRYVSYAIISTVFNLFLFYYIVVFCGIYLYTGKGWAISCGYCVLFKLAIAEVAGPLLGGCLRKNDLDGDR